ncbi:MAG: choice-of-anchor M domain-containing protein [Planctomycetia bacterium]
MKTLAPLGPIARSGLALAWLGGAALLGVAPTGPALAAPAIYTSGHADVGVGYHDGHLEPHWHTHSGAVVDGVTTTTDGEYAPADMIARTTSTRLTPSGGGGLSAALGVPNGTKVWVMGATTYQPDAGWGADELNPDDWNGNITVTFNPLASTFPSGGAFALYTTNIGGTSIVDTLFSSVSAGATGFNNTLQLTPGGHTHFQWAFTEEGFYGLNFTWTGEHVVDGLKTASATFGVQAVPEPSTVAMLAMAGGTAAIAAIRHLRRAASTRSR